MERSIEPYEVMWVDYSSTWMEPRDDLPPNGTFPFDVKGAEHIKKAEWLILHNGILYKRSYACPLLRCVTPEVGQKIVEEIHEDAYSGHIGRQALAVTAFRTRYYWSCLRDDAMNLVKAL